MGANFCGCCSRKTTHRAKNSGHEREAMLAASNIAPEPKQQASNGAKAEKAAYGAMEDDEVSYVPLNLDKPHNDCSKHHKISRHPVVIGVSQENAKGANKNGYEHKDLEEEQHEFRIPATQTNVIISNAGFEPINGDYRWFLHSQKWCLFREDVAFCMARGIPVQDVYDQLQRLQSKEANFRWSDDVTQCWIMSTLDGSNIYYAAPQTDDEFIPILKQDWISVHGSLPSPEIFPNLIEDSKPPDMDEEFGNASSPKTLTPTHKKAASSQSSLPSITESDSHLEKAMENANDEQVKEEIRNEQEADEEEESMSELEE